MPTLGEKDLVKYHNLGAQLDIVPNVAQCFAMHVVTYSQARANLKALMDRAVDDSDRVIITRQRGRPVVMMALDDLENMDETLRIESNSRRAQQLLDGIRELDEGRGIAIDPDTMTPIV